SSKSENQWLVILDLSKSAIQKLDEDHSCLEGIEYRFAWEGHAGLLKIVPSFEHDSVTDGFTRVLDLALIAMGLIGWLPRRISQRRTRGNKVTRDFFRHLAARLPPGSLPAGQPSLLRRGYLNRYLSLDKMLYGGCLTLPARFESSWSSLFRNEKIESLSKYGNWRHRTARDPSQGAYIQTLCQQSPNSNSQQCCSMLTAHTRSRFSANGVTSAPLTLPFVAVYDRPPAQGEGDIVLTGQDFLDVTSDLF
ncbi:hypothetical protein N7516_002102, partial [Penicillium verrucosum]|uniref:uncharacterized protein n=1 Tax=Penicillium verrucosum TaxID=60171 RepID=UPI0025452EF8